MAISLAGIIDRAFRVANMTGQDSNSSLTVDSQVVLEDLAPIALREAIVSKGGNPNEAGGLKRDHVLSFVNGTAVLPDTVIEERLDTSSLYSSNNPTITQFSSFQRRTIDYVRVAHSQLAYYTVSGRNILFRGPNGNPGTFTGNITLSAVSMPAVVSITTDLGISTDIAEEAIIRLAAMLVERANVTEVKIRREEDSRQ